METTAVSPELLSALIAKETARFVRLHPRSGELARSAQNHMVSGVPMPWMARWPGSFPIFVDEAQGGHFVDVDGNE
jgi:glutamate-1-semialdehyde 2,1-aminomutase